MPPTLATWSVYDIAYTKLLISVIIVWNSIIQLATSVHLGCAQILLWCYAFDLWSIWNGQTLLKIHVHCWIVTCVRNYIYRVYYGSLWSLVFLFPWAFLSVSDFQYQTECFCLMSHIVLWFSCAGKTISDLGSGLLWANCSFFDCQWSCHLCL